MRKRIFASLLALVMLLSLLPTTVLAASEDGTDDETPAATVETSDSDADSATPDEPEPPADGDENDYYETDAVTDPAVAGVQALIDDLPAAEDITADNAEEVAAQLDAIDEAKSVLSDEQVGMLDFTPYAATVEALSALAGQPETNEPELLVDADMSGNCGAPTTEGGAVTDAVKWQLTSNNDKPTTYTLTISGSGAMADFSSNTARGWNSLEGTHTITAVVVNQGVTYIGSRAFQGMNSCTSISLPASVTNMHELAFGSMTGLTEITVDSGNTVYKADDGILFSADGKTLIKYPAKKGNVSYAVPSGVTTLNKHAFSNISVLTTLTLPNTLNSIGEYAFQNSSGITSLSIPNAVTSMGIYAFSGNTSLETIVIGTGLTTIPNNAFSGCTALKSVSFEETSSLTTIGSYSFNGCSSLKTFTFPASLKTIEAYAFASTGLTAVNIGELQTIGKGTFQKCTNLKEVVIEGSDALSLPANLFSGTYSNSEYNNDHAPLETFKIGAASLTKGIFEKQKDTIKSISLGNVTGEGLDFKHFSSLESVEFGNGCSAIPAEVFFGCTNLKTLTISDGVISIGKNAFYGCTSLTSVQISKQSQLTTIAEGAFRDTKVTSVYIPSKVTSIGDYAFFHGSNPEIQTIVYDMSSLPSSSITKSIFGKWCFSQNWNNQTYTEILRIFYLPDSDAPKYLTKWSSENTDVYDSGDNAERTRNPVYAITGGGTFETTPTSGTELATPTRDGYKFDGWYSDSSFQNVASSVTAGSTYYAKWALNTPTVTVSPTSANTSVNGETVTLTAAVSEAVSDVTYSYKWYSNTDNKNVGGTEISDATGATYSPAITTAGTTYYYCVVTAQSDSGTATATTAVVPVTVASQAGSVTITGSKATATYGDESFTFTYTASKTATVTSSDISVATVSDNGGTVTVTIVGAGTTEISVGFVGGEDFSAASEEFTLTVNKAALTITPKNKTAYVGDALPTLGADDYTVTGLVGNDTLSEGPTLAYDGTPDMNTAGTYAIKASGAEAGDNYTITYVDGTLTVSRRSSGGGGGSSSSSSYTVSVDSTRNGDVTVSPKNASKGSKVTITVKPDNGYELDELTVTDKNGDTVKLTKSSDTKYTFTMPASKVTVEASFVEIEAAPDQGLPFVDVAENAYYHDAVAWAVENGVTGGTSATTFSPNQACTRAQAVTFLWRAAGSPVPKTASNPFTDVSTSAYYYDAVLWAVENGITAGTSATTFSPNNTCTRGQIVTFLYRAAGTTATGSNPFTDVADSAYYADAVKWAVAEGVTSGTSATTFGPDDACTRAQIVTFIYRAEA